MRTGLARAALIAVGDELLAGAHADLNSPELSRSMGALGIEVVRVAVLGDDEKEIAAAVEHLRGAADLIVLAGGLGPTLDDVTRHGVAGALGRDLVTDAESRAELEAWFERRGVEMPEPNLRQALMPAGAVRIPNRLGTAPGFWVVDGGLTVVVLPGPPAELRVLLHEELVPWLVSTGRGREPIEERRFHLFGLSESGFAEGAGTWMARDADPRMGCSAKKGILNVVLRARRLGVGAREALETRADEFRERFGRHVFSEEDPRLERALVDELIASGTTITTAESCTGGLVAALITRVSGVSAVFERGFVTYSDQAKVAELGVAPEQIDRHGAVSAEVAEAMAEGAVRVSGARMSVAITGIAGPAGGTTAKPVGLVHIASCLDGATMSEEKRYASGEREWIRTLAARAALHQCILRLRGTRRVD